MTEQGDPVDFLGWLLNQLHRDMGGGKKKNSCTHSTRSSIHPLFEFLIPITALAAVIYSTFQGEVRMETQQVIAKADEDGERPSFDIGRGMSCL